MLETLQQHSAFAALKVFFIWVPMLPTDSLSAAEVSDDRLALDAPRFWDGDRLAARATAAGIGAPGETAWDMYPFFSRGTPWEANFPTPLNWVHQVDSAWADLSQRTCGPELLPALVTAASTTVA